MFDWTCFGPGCGEDSQRQQNEGTRHTQLSHLHPEDTDGPDGLGSTDEDQTVRNREGGSVGGETRRMAEMCST